MKTTATVVLVLLAALIAGAADGDLEALADRLDAARRSWDAAAATAVLSKLRDHPRAGGSAAVRLRVEAGLAVAEILRFEYETQASDARRERRLLGDRIDAAAEEALSVVDRLPESSERERMRADLLATLIRSDFRARKHEEALRAAIDRALELDPGSALAHVTAAKPLLFAPEGRGRDTAAAVTHLERAVALDPELERAWLLLARAHEERGAREDAVAAARTALELNPASRPAAALVTELEDPAASS